MKKKAYITPSSLCMQLHVTRMLASSTEELPFDPGDGTGEALTKGQRGYNVWDDDWCEQHDASRQ